MSAKIIQPRVLKGFRDLLPKDADLRQELFDEIRQIFMSFGFHAIDTPALEYSEIILGKGSDETDKQLFRFTDQGGRDVALRFDLTVPLARFIATHGAVLGTPFKRYHIAPVWRAEKPQRGRFREFYQCDFDIIGSHSAAADCEVLLIAGTVLDAFGLPFTIRMNHRVILHGMIAQILGTGETPVLTHAMRSIDKIDKVGAEGVTRELCDHDSISNDCATELVRFLVALRNEDCLESALTMIQELCRGSESLTDAASHVSSILSCLIATPFTNGKVVFDASIARGLDYYTGIVFETVIDSFPELGSVCSGGRYNDLTSLFSKQAYPGVGGSVGIDRLMVALYELEWTRDTTRGPSVCIAQVHASLLPHYMHIAKSIRQAGIRCEVFPDAIKLGNQFKYADKNGYSHVIICGDEEYKNGTVQLKNIRSEERGQIETALAEIVNHIK